MYEGFNPLTTDDEYTLHETCDVTFGYVTPWERGSGWVYLKGANSMAVWAWL